MVERIATAVGTPNIALVKYWGKRDASLNLPANSSFSLTLDENLRTTTSVMFSDSLAEDSLFVDGEKQDLNDSKNEKSAFAGKVVNILRDMAGVRSKALIASRNTFPKSAGFASSASGGAALAVAASGALGLNLDTRHLSVIARQISGSACRSVCGGFVVWHAGEKDDGSDSYAESIAPASYWPEVIDIMAMISSTKKKVSSSQGHALTPKTSDLYKARPATAEEHVRMVVDAIAKKDFGAVAEVTMKDSNSMHAVMLDSFPPIIYLNDASRAVIYAIHELNESEGSPIAAYTFDAGPNAHIITLKQHKDKVISTLREIVGDNMLVAGIGDGPRLLGENESLIRDGARL